MIEKLGLVAHSPFLHLGGRGRRTESLRPTVVPLVSVKMQGKGRRGRRRRRLRKSHVRKLFKMVDTSKRTHTRINQAGCQETCCLQAMRNKCLLFEQLFPWCSVMDPKLIKTEPVEEIERVISMKGKKDGCSW